MSVEPVVEHDYNKPSVHVEEAELPEGYAAPGAVVMVRDYEGEFQRRYRLTERYAGHVGWWWHTRPVDDEYTYLDQPR